MCGGVGLAAWEAFTMLAVVDFWSLGPQHTVEPVLKDHPVGHKCMVSQDRLSLVPGSIALNCSTYCKKYSVTASA